MKPVVVAFPRTIYNSNQTVGGIKNLLPVSLLSVLGNAVKLRWELTSYARSSANARLNLDLYEGTKDSPRPSESPFSGQQLGSVTTHTALGLMAFNVTVDFSGRVDAVLWVDAVSGTTPEWIDAEVRVTLWIND